MILSKFIKTHKKAILTASKIVSVFGVLFIGFILFRDNILRSPGATASWFDGSYNYRKTVIVSNDTSSELINEHILVELDTATLISESKLQTDCDDIRFIDSDNTTNLSYWIEGGCNTSTTQVWVELPSLPSAGKDIYLYYGNTSVSAGTQTWAGNINIFFEGSCPSGWTYNADLTGKFLRGSDTYGTTGGSASHGHSSLTCTSSSLTGTITGPGTGSLLASSNVHTHTSLGSTVTDNADVLPPYSNLLACEKNTLLSPTGSILLFEDSVPSGWTRVASLDDTFVRVDTTSGGTGGSSTHTHSVTPTGTTSEATGSTGVSGLDVGDGADGAVVISVSADINTTNSISGRTCADGGDAVNYSVTALTSNTATLSSSVSAGCLSSGDDVLLINLQGISTAYSNVGNYEILEVSSVSGSTVTFSSNKTEYYGDGSSDDLNLGTARTNQRVMLQRVPNYTNLTVNSGINFYPTLWDGIKGGVLAFKASGTVTTTGTIHASGKGYAGGSGGLTSTTSTAYGGESICNVNSGGRGGNFSHYDGYDALCGGGGGGIISIGATNRYGDGGLGTATTGGAGGAGGLGGGNPAKAGSGGGGGYGLTGLPGSLNGISGGVDFSGDGGRNGGGSGGSYGIADLSKLYFGSAGGGGGVSVSNGGVGGRGAGIIIIIGDTVNVTGSIAAKGSQGGKSNGSSTSYFAGGGGSGAGGSIKIVGDSITIGTSLISASGGIASTGYRPGGVGGVGRIAIEYVSSISGTSTPTSNNTELSPVTYVPLAHTHNASSADMVAGNSLPSYLELLIAKADEEKAAEDNAVIITDVLPPFGWERYTALDNKFFVGKDISGGTGGSNTHTHNVTISTGAPSTTSSGVGSGATIANSTHTHSCTSTTDSGDNIPPYFSVIYAQKKVSQNITFGSEERPIPDTPTIGTPQALTTTSIRWTFTDNADDELGFKIYDTESNLKATCVGENLTYCDETGLSENTEYIRVVVAYNAYGNSDDSSSATQYTLISKPVISYGGTKTISSILLSATGRMNGSQLYFDCTDSSCDTGLNAWISEDTDTATDLSSNTGYDFVAKSKGGAGVTTADSDSVEIYTLADTPTISISQTTIETIELTSANTSNLATGTSGVNFECTGLGCSSGIGDWIKTNTDVVTGLTTNTEYTFRVKSRNYDGTETGYSSEVSGYTFADIPNISASNIATQSLSLDVNNSENMGVESTAVQFECTVDSCNTGINEWNITDTDSVTGLTANTAYIFEAKLRNAEAVETAYSEELTVHTLANIPTISSSNITTNSVTLTAGNTNNLTLGNAGIIFECTGTSCNAGIDEWINTTSDVVTDLAPETTYIFRVQARNQSGVETAYSSTISITTDAEPVTDAVIIINTSEDISVSLVEDESIDLTDEENSQEGEQKVRVKSTDEEDDTEYLLADISILFEETVDWENAILEAKPTEFKTVVKLQAEHGIKGAFTMYVVKGDTNAFRICPQAESLLEVDENCPDVVELAGTFPQQVPVEDAQVYVSQAVIGGIEYWVADGLTGTGAEGYYVDLDKDIAEDIVTSPFQEAKEIVEDIVEDIAEDIVNIVENIVGELEPEEVQIVAVTTSVTTVFVGLSTLLSSLGSIPYALLELFLSILSFLGFRKKTISKGYVYNSVTKEPIPQAVIRIYDPNASLVWTDVTNKEGYFKATELDDGKYSLSVTARNFVFPSKIVFGKEDFPLENVYHGDIFEVKSGEFPVFAIPVDSTKMKATRTAVEKFKTTFKAIYMFLHLGIFLFGLIFAMYAVITMGTWWSYLILILYIPSSYLLIRNLLGFGYENKWGIVKDISKIAVEGVIVGLTDVKKDEIVSKRVTNSEGKYNFVVGKGEYMLSVLNSDLKLVTEVENIVIDKIRNGKNIIAEDLIVDDVN